VPDAAHILQVGTWHLKKGKRKRRGRKGKRGEKEKEKEEREKERIRVIRSQHLVSRKFSKEDTFVHAFK